MTTLLENEYCKIIERDNKWIRVDKILNTTMEVDGYFNSDGRLITKEIA